MASLLARRFRLSGSLVTAVQDGVQNILPAYRGTVHAIKSIIAEEGWRALYSGLSPALFGAGELRSPCISAKTSKPLTINPSIWSNRWPAGIAWGTYFTSYNNAKQRWQRLGGSEQLTPVQHLLSAAEGGAVVRPLSWYDKVPSAAEPAAEAVLLQELLLCVWSALWKTDLARAL